MADKLLLVVEDSFQLSGRGATVAPFVSPDLLGTNTSGHKSTVRLVRPDGTKEITEATFYWEHFNQGGFHYACFLENGKKEQVPPGTEMWLIETD